MVCCFGRRELKILLEASLPGLEREIFLSLAGHRGKSFSCAVRSLSYPESTAKNVIRRLRAKHLIYCGDRDNTNVPLSFTDFGKKIYEVLGACGNWPELQKR